MKFSRREFIKTMGGSGLLYAVRFTLSAQSNPKQSQNSSQISLDEDMDVFGCTADNPEINYADWIVFRPDGTVAVFTGRTELGQGLKTVLTAIVSQGLEIPVGRLEIVMGDTDLCPDDGPTVGSSSTWFVGWGFWLACEKIREDLVCRAASSLEIPEKDLEYKDGGIYSKDNTNSLITASDLGNGDAVFMEIDPKTTTAQQKLYVDLEIPNVNAEKIVTGQLKYAGDVNLPGVHYAGWLIPPYHPRLTRIQDRDLRAAQSFPGVRVVVKDGSRVAAVADRFSTVHKALAQVKVSWSQPPRPKEHKVEEEARTRRRLFAVLEQKGDVEMGFAQSDLVVSETYVTQYTTQAPIETHTAVGQVDLAKKQATVWASSQYPHYGKWIASKFLKQPEINVRVIAMPAGGAFGGKTTPPVIGEAALLSRKADCPVKMVYTLKDQFQRVGAYKYAVVTDIKTGVKASGLIQARKADIYQDMGYGTDLTYKIPNVFTSNYQADEWPFGLAISRGTSYVQTCFASESHIDMVAHAIGMDPLKFRGMNVHHPAFIALLGTCSQRIGYKDYQPARDEGIGFAMANHGGNQLGAVAAKVAVDRENGKVSVKKICAAFDIGTVINRRTAIIGLRGGITWGIGYALLEEIKLDGHGPQTKSFTDYRIPHFSDIPEIDIEFLNYFRPHQLPRGCGELPVIPTIGAIANAVYNAIGVRFYSTPITPERVLNALYP